MADETTPTPAAPASGVQDVGGGALRVSPPAAAETGPTLEEEAAKQGAPAEGEQPAVAAEEGAKETPAAEETPAEEKAAPAETLKGTIFETLSPEMQTKVAPFAAAYTENGTLTDAEITEAAHATGMSEAVVRQFMAGAQAEVAASGRVVYDQFGGEEPFKEFQTWTKEPGNLTPREETTINKAIQSGDYETAAQLMAAPMDRWKANGGAGAPRDVTANNAGGDGGSAAATDVYANWAQVEAAMNNPKYKTDPAYRDSVEKKIGRSPLNG